MKEFSYKKWTLCFFTMLIIVMLLFFAFNYVADFYDFFRPETQHALTFFRDTRKVKMRHIAANPDKYDGYIIGGSKAGALNPDLIGEYENMNFYNVCVPLGCFYEYREYISYILEHTSAKKIILHIGSIEVASFTQDPLPAVITPGRRDDLKEYFQFLFMNPAQAYHDYVFNAHSLENGAFDYEKTQKRILEEEGYIKEDILGLYPESANYLIYRTFHEDKKLKAFDENILALSSIVNMCNAKNVELDVIIGPTYLYELNRYEGDLFWSYLRQIASLTNFWDFSGFLDENRNPYNFINSEHYNMRMGNEMINIMYGKKQREGFGTYVTPDTFETYINNRMSKYFEMQKIVDDGGTIDLIDTIDDPSFVE